MVEIRRAQESDREGMQAALDEPVSPDEPLENFWVAVRDGEIAGVAKLQDMGRCLYLSHLGVPKKFRNENIATRLLNAILPGQAKDVYIYTVIPDFFSRFQFVKTKPPTEIPPRRAVECRGCSPTQCTCMVRKA